MPRKHKIEKLDKDSITVLEMPDVKPIGVFSNALDKVLIGKSNKTFANEASEGRGPRYSMVNGRRFYLWSDLEAYVKAHPVQTAGTA